MQNSQLIHRHLVIPALLLLTACSVNLPLTESSIPVQSQSRETSNLADVTMDVINLTQQTGKENLLVVFDIDNTLLAMEQGLGADQWYEWQKELSQHDRCSDQNVGDRFAVQGALYFISAMRRTQEDGAAQVSAIQDLGVTVIALTSRGPDYQLQTFRELRRNGFNFSHFAFGPAGGYSQPFVPVENGRLSLYQDGVFLTAGQHKGKMLYSLLEKTETRMPGVIVIVDDNWKNLEAVTETFSALDIPVHAWRYSGEDENVRNFDTKQANTQWHSIEDALRQIQSLVGPDNYDLSSVSKPAECP